MRSTDRAAQARQRECVEYLLGSYLMLMDRLAEASADDRAGDAAEDWLALREFRSLALTTIGSLFLDGDILPQVPVAVRAGAFAMIARENAGVGSETDVHRAAFHLFEVARCAGLRGMVVVREPEPGAWHRLEMRRFGGRIEVRAVAV
jgi:hypothetical protein